MKSKLIFNESELANRYGKKENVNKDNNKAKELILLSHLTIRST